MISEASTKKIKRAIAISAILKEPFICLYKLLPFFLLKDLGALSIYIIIDTQLRPMSALFSFYLSGRISEQRMTLQRAILWTGILARLSFIPALLTDNVLLYVLGSTFYMIFSRAETPAWIEVIKKNVYKEVWEKTFSFGSILSYTTGAILTIVFRKDIDQGFLVWKTFFIISLVLGVIAVCVQAYMVDNDQQVKKRVQKGGKGFINPIKEAAILMRKNDEFRYFQIAFMIGGFGLMIIQPVIPIYFAGTLHISASDMMTAFYICKALGFVVTTPLWNTLLKKRSPSIFILFVLFGFALFSFFLIFSSSHGSAIFLAYLIFGVAQAGSHLIWHLSGPIFSKEESSSRYSAVNIVMVGLRGVIGPAFGGLMLLFLHPTHIFGMSMILCVFGGLFYIYSSKSASLRAGT